MRSSDFRLFYFASIANDACTNLSQVCYSTCFLDGFVVSRRFETKVLFIFSCAVPKPACSIKVVSKTHPFRIAGGQRYAVKEKQVVIWRNMLNRFFLERYFYAP